MTNATFTLPAWAVTVVVVLYVIEKVISLKLVQKANNLLHRLWIFIRYHNDSQYYKECQQREEARRQVARVRVSRGGKYSKKSLAELAKKQKGAKSDDSE
jgi:hypothetical protein